MNAHANTTIARETFARIEAAFPQLKFVWSEGGNVDLCMVASVQDGLKHEVVVNLQDDELHFVVGHFWMEWFPCEDPKKVERFVEAVTGFLAGHLRVVERYRGSKCVKAQLQAPAPAGVGWEAVATWRKLSLPMPLQTREEVVSNA